MRIIGSIFLVLLFGLSVPVRAETTVYLRGRALEVPPPVILLVGGLALIALGFLIRKWFEETQAPESEPDDVNVTGPLPGIDLPVADEKHADQDRVETSRPAA